MSDVVQLISTVGFPIVACLAMGYYVKYITDRNADKISDMEKQHKEEMTTITQALNNNTLAVQRLTDFIQGSKTKKDEDDE